MQKHAQRQFFRDIHKWIKEGCPRLNDHQFRSDVGLCGNYQLWCDSGNKQKAQKPFQFVKNSPFNLSLYQYSVEAYNETIYQNAERLAYIKKHS